MSEFRIRAPRLLPAVLATALLPSGFAAPTADILTGDEETPAIAPATLTIRLDEQTKKAVFGIDTRHFRLFRIATQSSGVEVSQEARAVELNAWYFISSPLNFTVLVRDSRPVELQVEFIKRPARDLEKAAGKQGGIFGKIPAPEGLEKAPKMTAILQVEPAGPGAPSAVQATGISTGRLILYAGILIAATLGIVFVLRSGMMRREVISAQGIASIIGPVQQTAPPPLSEPPPVPVTPSYVKQLESQLEAMQQESRRSVGQLGEVVQSRLREMEERLRNDPAGRTDVNMLRTELKGHIDRLENAVRQLHRTVEESAKAQGAEIEKLRQKMQVQASVEAGRAADAEKRLEELLRLMAAQPGTGDLAARLEQGVSDFFARSVPGRGGLEALGQRVGNLSEAIERLWAGLGSRGAEVEEKIQPAATELKALRKELDELLEAADTKTLRLSFAATFYASAANRESLGTAIASGLREQIAKLDRPEEHLARRLLGAAASAAQVFSDFLDTRVDPQRGNAKLQQTFAELVAAGQMEQIMPAAGDEFKAIEQSVVHMLPRPSGAPAGRSVARLVARGFRHNGEVLRKAAVILYE